MTNSIKVWIYLEGPILKGTYYTVDISVGVTKGELIATLFNDGCIFSPTQFLAFDLDKINNELYERNE